MFDGEGTQGLTDAVSSCNLDRARELLNRGADANATGVDVAGKITYLMAASRSGDYAIANLLLDSGANVDDRSDYGLTALMFACSAGHESIAKLLMSNGAGIDERDTWGKTALMCAAGEGHTEIVGLALEAGGEVNARASNGDTALSAACFDAHRGTVELLLKRGAIVHKDALLACAGDSYEIQTLLEAHQFDSTNSGIIERLKETADIDARDGAGLTPLIGEGGMGEVYRARDTKLDRDVALKVLPQAFTDDPDRLARFEREAKVLASLNHPNIGHIYGLEEAAGQKALVLELVEGPTLADRIKQGPIPVDEALPIAKQIAEAIEAAHEQGVIHRDLKPANIKVRAVGMVKVLDFGLAKAFEPEAGSVSASMSPTISLTAAATQMGMVIGTAAYMAPEQAGGKTVDKRADVWAFGVVLYEILVGTRPFVGDDVSKTLARMIDREPDWSVLPTNVPPVLGTFLRGCLEKNPKQRVGDIRDVRLAIEGAFETAANAAIADSPVSQQSGWRPVVAWTLASFVVGAVVTGIIVAAFMRPVQMSGPMPSRFSVMTPDDGLVRATGPNRDVAISPDGTSVVYMSGGTSLTDHVLYIRQLADLNPTALRGTEGAANPFFSPDGSWVGFRDALDNTLKRVSVLGGPPVTMCDCDISPSFRGASWGSDDMVVFATSNRKGLFRVPMVGGEPETLTTIDPELGETEHWWPHVLPNLNGPLDTHDAL